MGRKICIVATGTQSLPFFWPSAEEIWGVKQAAFALRAKGYKCSKAFYLDSFDTIKAHFQEMPIIEKWEYGDTMKFVTSEIPQQYPNMPWLEGFNIESLVAYFNTDYVVGSGGMSLAYVALHNAECMNHQVDGFISEIMLHGFDFYPEESRMKFTRYKEMLRQAANCAYWVGRLEGMGVRVVINPMSPFMDAKFKTMHGALARGFSWDRLQNLSTSNVERMQEVAEQMRENKVKAEEENPTINQLNLPFITIDNTRPLAPLNFDCPTFERAKRAGDTVIE